MNVEKNDACGWMKVVKEAEERVDSSHDAAAG